MGWNYSSLHVQVLNKCRPWEGSEGHRDEPRLLVSLWLCLSLCFLERRETHAAFLQAGVCEAAAAKREKGLVCKHRASGWRASTAALAYERGCEKRSGLRGTWEGVARCVFSVPKTPFARNILKRSDDPCGNLRSQAVLFQLVSIFCQVSLNPYVVEGNGRAFLAPQPGFTGGHGWLWPGTRWLGEARHMHSGSSATEKSPGLGCPAA